MKGRHLDRGHCGVERSASIDLSNTLHYARDNDNLSSCLSTFAVKNNATNARKTWRFEWLLA